MIRNYDIFVFSKSEIKFLIFGSLIGGFLDIVSYRYLKKKSCLSNEKMDGPQRKMLPKGVTVGLTLASLIIVKNRIPVCVIKYIYGALPYSYSENGKLLIKHLDFNIKFPFEYCSNDFQQIFAILNNSSLPTAVKREYSYKILVKYLDITTSAGRTHCILCLASTIWVFATTNNITSFYILIENLIRALKSGRISKEMAKAIIRILMQVGFEIDPELIAAST